MTPSEPRTLEPDSLERDPRTVRRAAWAGLIGTMLEQYDFVIYGTASAIIFNELFFPNVDPVIGVMASFSTYAVGFAARPLGGFFFSRYGDRIGRKWVLVTTLFLMGIATFAIGLLPTYDQVGILAPALLVALRMVQGFGAGAEQAGGIVLLTETAKAHERGRLSSLVYVGAAAGTALGAVIWIVVQWLPDEAFTSYGWRLVFLSSIFVTIAAFVIRRRLAESPVFKELEHEERKTSAPVREVFVHGRTPLLRTFFLNVGANAQSYTFQVFMGAYLIDVIGRGEDFVPKVLLAGALCACVSAWVFGLLSDRYGRKPVYVNLTASLIVLPVPAFLMLNSGSTVLIALAIILGFVLAAYGSVGVQSSYLPELFGAKYRYAGVALGREFSAVFGGGFAPLICSGLLAAFSDAWWPVAAYMMLMMAFSFAAAVTSPETRGRDLTLDEDAGAPADRARNETLAARR